MRGGCSAALLLGRVREALRDREHAAPRRLDEVPRQHHVPHALGSQRGGRVPRDGARDGRVIGREGGDQGRLHAVWHHELRRRHRYGRAPSVPPRFRPRRLAGLRGDDMRRHGPPRVLSLDRGPRAVRHVQVNLTRRAALFDMDRTLVRRETATLYVRYQREIGEATLTDLARTMFWVAQYTLGVIDVEDVAARATRSL